MPVWDNHETVGIRIITQVNNCDLHVHVSVHVLIYVSISERTCCELFSLVVVVIGKGLGQVHGFSVDIT